MTHLQAINAMWISASAALTIHATLWFNITWATLATTRQLSRCWSCITTTASFPFLKRFIICFQCKCGFLEVLRLYGRQSGHLWLSLNDLWCWLSNCFELFVWWLNLMELWMLWDFRRISTQNIQHIFCTNCIRSGENVVIIGFPLDGNFIARTSVQHGI